MTDPVSALPRDVGPALEYTRRGKGPIVFLTGAGVSAESGIPTFRGADGYWRVGSRNYHPTEMATFAAFKRMLDEVWSWYLYRRSVCRAAEPNAAHRAVAELEAGLGDRFVLVTQNVDGLHLRAGSSPGRTFQIHGNVDFMRCADECTGETYAIPDSIDLEWPKARRLSDEEREALRCPRCGAQSRPHVLWFDETYDEEHFRFESSIGAAVAADLLVVVGTTGATNLPLQIGALVARRGAAMIVINPEANPFTELAGSIEHGVFLEGTAGRWVPPLCRRIVTAIGSTRAQ